MDLIQEIQITEVRLEAVICPVGQDRILFYNKNSSLWRKLSWKWEMNLNEPAPHPEGEKGWSNIHNAGAVAPKRNGRLPEEQPRPGGRITPMV
jgi:hypothetical protein